MPRRSKKRTKKQPLKAYGYCRVSTEEQAREGISLDAQEEKIQEYAKFKDLELVKIIREEGESGKNLDRPGLQKLLQLVEDQKAEALIVYKLDRLTRNTSDLLQLVEEIFKKGNTRFFSITEEIDTDSAMGKFFLTIMGAMAQMERELVSERTSAALQYKKSQGDSLGKIPFGWDRIDGQLVRDPAESKLLRKLKRWRKKGDSYAKIAQKLNEQGIKPKRKNTKWHASSVYYILNRKKR